MKRPSAEAIEKVVFVFSLAILAYLLGYATRGFGWFPDAVLESGFEARSDLGALVTRSPTYVSERVYQRSGVRVVRPDEVQPGVTLISSIWPDLGWNAGVKLIDADGQVLHEWSIDESKLFPESLGLLARWLKSSPVHGTHLFENGDLLVNVQNVGTVRLDACGEVLWRLPARSHHSIAVADDGTYWIAAERRAAPARAEAYPRLDSPRDHRLLHVSSEGEILEEIDVLETLYVNGLKEEIIGPYLWSIVTGDELEDDITHLNDVEPLSASMAAAYPLFEAGDLLISLRNLNLVFVLDPDTRRIRWYRSDPWLHQHDPDYMGDGWIGVFDNRRDGTSRGTELGGSRVVAVQPHTDSVETVTPASRSESFFTNIMGKWQALENGNFLLTESQAGRILEITPDGRSVWEWLAPQYKRKKVALVLEGSRYPFTQEQVASWRCSSAGS